MTSLQPTALPARIRRRVVPLLLVLSTLLTGRTMAQNATDPYDTLYDVIMTRFGPDGKAYARDESSPSIFRRSTFPFGDHTFEKLSQALDAFAALPQTKIEAYSDIQRALMQRHLWHVFDATAPYMWTKRDRTGKPLATVHDKPNQDRREALRPHIASLIRRLALTKKEILALPDTRAVTLKTGGFAPQYDAADPFKPFLPTDLFADNSAWVRFGFDGDAPAPDHSNKLKFRSAFHSFISLPGGRGETLEYIRTGNQERGKTQNFPVGTQFALVEQAFLISDDGEMILSPLVNSISLRAYLNVEERFWRGRPIPTQCLAEFVAQPRQLMEGNAVMKALRPDDMRFAAGDVGVACDMVEPFETTNHVRGHRSRDMLRKPRLKLCMTCHGRAGVRGATGGGGLFGVKQRSHEDIVKKTLAYKQDDYTWKTLRELWQADSEHAR